jgi:methyl-accepting chemotaxis protein
MDILLRIGIPGWIIIICQLAVFGLILNLGLDVDKSTRPVRLALSRCLRESRDLIPDNDSEMNLARNCATRYRIAAARIEDVDAYAISNSEISRATASRLFKRSWSYLKIDELLHGGSGFLVTLGLIGTFFGLMANMVQLSELVLASESTSQQASLMQGLAAVFPSMAAAFTTSLVGVLLSSILWIIGTINGMLSLKDELVELLSGYLEQVVQADCRRYSLVGESMERMEKYLTDYLSRFSDVVGGSIERAIMKNISSLVSALNYQVDQVTSLVSRIKEDSGRLSDAGQLYYRASKVLSESDFAEKFGDACTLFLESSDQFSRSSALLADASTDAASSSKKLSESITVSSEVTESLGNSLIEAKSNTAKVLSLGVDSIEKLREATGAIEGIQKRGMTWLSMRAKTDQQLMEINSQLNDVIANIANVAIQVANTRASDIEEIRRNVSTVSDIADRLSEAVMRQDNATREVMTGLDQMKMLAARIASLDSLPSQKDTSWPGNINA